MTSDASVAQRLLEELLPGLVAFEHDDRLHDRILLTDRTRKCRQSFVLRFCAAFSSLPRYRYLDGKEN